MTRFSELKNKVVRFSIYAVTLLAVLWATGCSMPNSPDRTASQDKDGASIYLSFSSPSSRTIAPNVDMRPSYYEITGKGPAGKTISQKTALSSINISGLTGGEWTMTVLAKNTTGLSIGSGTGTATLVVGSTVGLDINVSPYVGTGVVSLDLTWPTANVTSPAVSAVLIPVTGSNIPLIFTVSSGKATITDNVPSGYYTLVVNLLDGTTPVMGTVEVVRVIADQTTTGAINFTAVNNSTGSSQVTISPALSSALAVTIGGGSPTLALGSSMTLTASVANTTNLTYNWYLNGSKVKTGVSYATGSALAAGSYIASVTAFSADGTQGGSASYSFSVAASTTPPPTSSITHGSQLTALNTGVPSGHTLTNVTSTITVTESWITNSNGGSRILENKNFTNGADLIISVDNFTVQYCKFNGTSGLSMFNFDNNAIGTNGKVYYCEFDGNNENGTDEVAIYGSSVYVKGVHVHEWPRAMWIGDGNVTVEECYFHDITADGSGAHIENIYVAGGTNMSFIRNKLVSNEIKINGNTALMTSGSLAIYNEDYDRGYPFGAFPSLNYILVQDNYFESDGYYPLYCGALSGKGGAYAKNEVIKGNVFGRTTGMGGDACAYDASQPGNVWSNNTWGPKGASTPASAPAEGTIIAAPTAM